MAANQRRAGVVLSYISLIIYALLSFIYVPLLIHGLTVADYGVYEMIGSVIAYLSVMDMGLSTTLNRFYVKTYQEEGEQGLNRLLSTSAIIYAGITILAIIVAFGCDWAINPLFRDTFTYQELSLAHQMMMLVVINCAVVLPGNWFLAIINANERFIFARALSIAKYVLQFIGIISVLSFTPNATYVLLIQVFFNAAAVIAYAIYCFKVISLKIERAIWDKRLAWSLVSFSFFILLNMVFDQVFWKTGQIILGAVSGATAVAVYGVVTKFIATGFMQLSTGVTSVFLPKLTKLEVDGKRSEMNEAFINVGRIQAMLVWGLTGWFIAFGYMFCYLWIGNEMNLYAVYFCIVILMIGLTISLVQNLGISVLQAKNKMGFRSIVYIILAILDVIISIPISQAYGEIGCACVAAILLLIGTGPIMNIYYSRVIKLNIPEFWKRVLPLLIPVVIISTLACLINTWIELDASWTGLVVGSFVYFFVYMITLRAFFFNSYEKQLIRDIFRLRTKG